MDKDNLIEYLSGGNHELFHSNLLAYIAKRYKETFPVLFPEIKDVLTGFDEKDVEREKKNFDLSIKNRKARLDNDEEDYLLILENKMKSFANMEQLQKYREKSRSKSYILLSLLDPDKEDLREIGWQLITYDELASRLKSLIDNNKIKIDKFFSTFLEYYVKYIQNLSDIVKQIKKDFNNSLDSKTIQEYLYTNENDNEDIPNWQKLFVRKVRFQLVCERIKLKIKGNDIICTTGIVRGLIPFMEVTPHSKEELDKKIYNYWVLIYDDHIERGFTIHYDFVPGGDELKKNRPKKRAQKERQKFFESVWDKCMKINLFKNISQTLSQKYNLPEFEIKEKENTPEFRGYIYDSFAMIDLHSDLPDITIQEFIDSIAAETIEMRSLINQDLQNSNNQEKQIN